MSVVALHGGIRVATGKPNEALVKGLEQMLGMAKTGQLQSFIGTGFTVDGLRASTWADYHDNVYQMLGGLEWLKYEYIARHPK